MEFIGNNDGKTELNTGPETQGPTTVYVWILLLIFVLWVVHSVGCCTAFISMPFSNALWYALGKGKYPNHWIFCPIVPECTRVQISSKVSVVECVHWALWSCDVTEPARLHGVNPEWPKTLDENHTHSLKTALACVVKPTFKACFFSPSLQKSCGGGFGYEPPFLDGIKQFILNHKIWFQSGQSAF